VHESVTKDVSNFLVVYLLQLPFWEICG